MRIAVGAIGLLLAPLSAWTHHSTAHYVRELHFLEGEIAAIQWRNPHIQITLRTFDDDGQEALWQMESNSTYNLQRAGITRDLLAIGTQVRVAGQASRLEDYSMLVTNLMLPDGTEVVLRRDAQPLWSGPSIGGRERWLAGDGPAVQAAAENKGIFRVWSASEVRISTKHYPFTEAAIAGRQSWDTLDNFMTRCEGPGMPYIMDSPHPHEFVDLGDTIELRVQLFDQVRTIHVNDAASAESQPASRLGYSVGRWEDDSTLVVHTSRINWPYFDRIGTFQTEAVEVIERFSLSDDQSRLDYHMTVIDPAVFTAPATMATTWLALGDSVNTYDCAVL